MERNRIPDKGGVYETNVRVVNIVHEKGFYYMACGNCKRKIVEENTCTHCAMVNSKIPTYLFAVQVTDGTGTAWARVIGNEGEKLVGKPAQEVVSLKETGGNYKEILEGIKRKVC